MKLSAIHIPATRHIERIEIMTAETEAGTRGVIGQRKNRRHTPVAIENLDSHPRGNIGSSSSCQLLRKGIAQKLSARLALAA